MPLTRRNTIAAVPCPVTLPAKPHHQRTASFNAAATPPSTTTTTTTTTTTNSSYTSMKDVIAASPVSTPTAIVRGSSAEITIRNHLVKQAAWAYLQPMSSPESAVDNLLCGMVAMVLNSPIFSFFRFAAQAVTNAVTNAFACLFL